MDEDEPSVTVTTMQCIKIFHVIVTPFIKRKRTIKKPKKKNEKGDVKYIAIDHFRILTAGLDLA